MLEAQLSAPMSRESVACVDLVTKFLSQPSGPIHDYLQDLLDQGVPALRIDCGFDYSSKRAFFSEFGIPTDASYWPTIHNLPLAMHIAEEIGFLIFTALDREQSESGAASSSVAAAASTESSAPGGASEGAPESASEGASESAPESVLGGALESAPESVPEGASEGSAAFSASSSSAMEES